MASRRSTLRALVVALAASAGTGWFILQKWLPWISQGPDGRWRLGPGDRFPPGTATLLRRANAILVHDQNGVHALSAVCTHQSCTVYCGREDKVITCPCHGSLFSLDGEVKRGPAQSPLPWLAVTLEDGELVLDATRTVPRSPG